MSIVSYATSIAVKAAERSAASAPQTEAGTVATQAKVFAFGVDEVGAAADAAAHDQDPYTAVVAVGAGIALAVLIGPEVAAAVGLAAIAEALVPLVGGSISVVAMEAILAGVMEAGIGAIAGSVFEEGFSLLIDLATIPSLYNRLDGPNMPQSLGPSSTGTGGPRDPLVFDLDGDSNIEVINASQSGIYFDYNNDGFATSSGWVSADDGMFAIDLDGSGKIDSVSELFGSVHSLSYLTESFVKTLGTENGFANLAAYDTNDNGVVDNQDAQWGDIRIWQDVNQDGVSQAAELMTLDQVGIATVDVRSYELARDSYNLLEVIDGNTVSHRGTVTMTDTSIRKVYDVWLAAGDETVSTHDIELKFETYFLPVLKGYGTLLDLNYAASVDDDLFQSLTDFADTHTDFASDLANLAAVKQEVANLVLQWAGIDLNDADVNYLTQGVYSELPGYRFLHRLTGFDIVEDGPWFQGSPFMPGTVDGVDAIITSWDALINGYTARLLLQTSGADLFGFQIGYNLVTDQIVGTADLSEAALSSLAAEIANSSDPWAAWKDVVTFITTIKSIGALTTEEIGWLDAAIQSSTSSAHDWADILEAFSSTTIYDLATGSETAPYADETFHGTSGQDTISASNGRYDDYSNDTLYGHDGDDVLRGGYGNDILVGGAGNDHLSGGYGDDTYVYESGTDFISEDANTGKTAIDTIEFVAGISQSDVSVDYAFNGFRAGVPASQNYVIQIEERGSIIVENITGGYSPLYIGQIIDQLKFDGAANPVSINDVAIRFWGTDDADIINLRNWGDTHSGPVTVYAGAGNDTINGFGEADHLFDLGLGNDQVAGGNGDDTYIVHAGIKTIYDWGGSDTVILPEGVAAGDLVFHKVSLDGWLYRDMEIIAGDTTIYIPGAFDVDPASGIVAIDTIQFSDETTLSIASQTFDIIGTDGNDVFSTPYYGAWADDVYVFGQGDDVISDNGGTDVIRFAEGVTLNDLTIERFDGAVPGAGWIGAHLIISDAYGNSLTVANAFDATNTTQNILTSQAVETLLFADNTSVSVSSLTIGQAAGSAGAHDEGSAGNDTIAGTIHADTLSGGAGNDNISGGDGNDVLFGGTGEDYLYGGAGSDTYYYYSGDGHEHINEYLDGGYDTLVLADLTINDVSIWTEGCGNKAMSIKSNLNANDHLEFNQGGGIYQGKPDIQYYVERIVFADGFGVDLTKGLYLTGTGSSGDLLAGSDGNDVITSQAGNDSMGGGLGDDTYIFNLGDGQDSITEDFAAGFDTIRFGAGITSDMVHITTPPTNTPSSMPLQFVIDGSTDTLTLLRSSDTDSENQSAPSGARTVERVEFEDGTVWDLTKPLLLTASAVNNNIKGSILGDLLLGSAVADVLYGSDGNDQIAGGAGNDQISGGGGNDVMQGDEGADTLYGGTGDDTYIFMPNMGADVIDEAVGEGFDTLLLAGGMRPDTIRMWSDVNGNLYIVNKFNPNEVVKVEGEQVFGDNGHAGSNFGARMERISFETGENIDLTGGIYSEGSIYDDLSQLEALYGTQYGDTILGLGGNDNVKGLDGNDILYGDDGTFDGIGDGNDYLNGNDGDDILYGEGGNDQLYGGSGNDILDGGTGSDTLIGQGGDDVFVYKIGYGQDTISDFSRGEDRIDLSFISGIYELDDLNIEVAYGNTYITFSGSDTLTVSGESSLQAWQAVDFIFAPVPDVVGTANDDTLVGT
ncbi:MAG: calcium-binding protein, partial [Pseudobdellovibrionaceae bacterium]